MPKFFVSREQITEQEILLLGENAHHIARALRMAVGDALTVCDGLGMEYDCRILSFQEDREVRAEICGKRLGKAEPPCRILLFQALPKGDKLDTVIQKAVECGASEIIPFESEHCVVKQKAEAEERKTERRRRIAEEAAKQCGRSLLPQVRKTVSFEEMLVLASDCTVGLFCYEGEGTVPLGQWLAENRDRLCSVESKGADVAVVIGSEGGFSPREVQLAERRGLIPVGLGRRILRTETASGFALACISCMTELGG